MPERVVFLCVKTHGCRIHSVTLIESTSNRSKIEMISGPHHVLTTEMGLISKQPRRIYDKCVSYFDLIIGYQLQVIAQLNILKWFMDLPGCFKRFHHLAIPWHPHLRGRALGQWKEAKVPCWCRVISHPAGGSVSRLSSLVNDYNLTQYRPVDGWNLAKHFGDFCCFKDPFSGLDSDGMMTCDLCLLSAGTGPKHYMYINKDKEATCSLHLLNLVKSLKVEISEFIIYNFLNVWDLCGLECWTLDPDELHVLMHFISSNRG